VLGNGFLNAQETSMGTTTSAKRGFAKASGGVDRTDLSDRGATLSAPVVRAPWSSLLQCPDCKRAIDFYGPTPTCLGCRRVVETRMEAYDLLPRDQPPWDSVEAAAQSWRGWLAGRIYSPRFARIEARLRSLLSEMAVGTWGLNVGSSNTRLH